jgi:hypothetical protein
MNSKRMNSKRKQNRPFIKTKNTRKKFHKRKYRNRRRIKGGGPDITSVNIYNPWTLGGFSIRIRNGRVDQFIDSVTEYSIEIQNDITSNPTQINQNNSVFTDLELKYNQNVSIKYIILRIHSASQTGDNFQYKCSFHYLSMIDTNNEFIPIPTKEIVLIAKQSNPLKIFTLVQNDTIKDISAKQAYRDNRELRTQHRQDNALANYQDMNAGFDALEGRGNKMLKNENRAFETRAMNDFLYSALKEQPSIYNKDAANTTLAKWKENNLQFPNPLNIPYGI